MPFADFRQFLDVLRQHGELIDINRPVALNDVGKAMKQAYVRNGPAIMFNNNGTDYPLVAGIYSTREKALLAFEADEVTIFDKVLHGLDNPIAPTFARNGAPCRVVDLPGRCGFRDVVFCVISASCCYQMRCRVGELRGRAWPVMVDR